MLADFYAANYTAPRMVLAGAGVEHEELVRLAGGPVHRPAAASHPAGLLARHCQQGGRCMPPRCVGGCTRGCSHSSAWR